MYGLRKAGQIRGLLILSYSNSWKFDQKETEPSALIFRRGSEVIIIIVVLDDIVFSINYANLMKDVKEQLDKELDVNVFG